MTVEDLVEDRFGVRQAPGTDNQSDGSRDEYLTVNLVDVRLDRETATLLISAISLVLAAKRTGT